MNDEQEPALCQSDAAFGGRRTSSLEKKAGIRRRSRTGIAPTSLTAQLPYPTPQSNKVFRNKTPSIPVQIALVTKRLDIVHISCFSRSERV